MYNAAVIRGVGHLTLEQNLKDWLALNPDIEIVFFDVHDLIDESVIATIVYRELGFHKATTFT